MLSQGAVVLLAKYRLYSRYSERRSLLSNTYMNSACSGVVSATLGTPADVMKTRMMNQPYGSDGKGLLYRSTLNCFVQTVCSESYYHNIKFRWFKLWRNGCIVCHLKRLFTFDCGETESVLFCYWLHVHDNVIIESIVSTVAQDGHCFSS